MKTIPTTLLVLSGALVAGACSASRPIPPASTTFAARTTAAEAVTQIAAARCDKEQRCNTERSDTDSVQRCRISEQRDIDKDFGDNPNCPNGVADTDLKNCVAKLKSQSCGALGTLTEGMQTSRACGSTQLCLR